MARCLFSTKQKALELFPKENLGVIKKVLVALKTPRGLCCDSRRGVRQWLLMAWIRWLTLRASLPSEGQYGQMAELLVLQPGLEEKLSSFGPHTLMGFRSLSKLSSAPKLAYASSIQRGPASFLFLSLL